MKQLFPVEIQKNTVQNLFIKRNNKTKIIYLFIIVLLVCLCASLPFIYIDISTQSRGYIRTPGENNILQSAISGDIVETNIYENKVVSKGDTLIRIRMDELIESIVRNRQKLKENTEFINDLSSLLKGNKNPYTLKYRTEIAQYEAKIQEQDILLNQLKREYIISQTLYKKDLESKFNFEQIENKYISAKSHKHLLKQQQYNTWQAEKTLLEYKNLDLKSEYNQLENRKTQYSIIAPIAGNIVQHAGFKVGNFISPSQTIALITPTDSLIVECYITPMDIGYISKGQKVKIQVDAYDYRQWGLISGEVKEIIPDVVQINNMPFFRVRCSLFKKYLTLKNGYSGNLKKGMTITARFYLTKRSLAQLLFDKIDDWMNPKIIKDGSKD